MQVKHVCAAILCTCALFQPAVTVPLSATSDWWVETVAGNGSEQSVDGLALNSSISEPWGTALSADGESLFWAEFGGNRYRNDTRCDDAGFRCSILSKSNPACNSQAPGRTGYGGLNPCDCGCDIFFMHSAGHRIRVLRDGRVSTVAGSGVRGFRDGKASEAYFNHPNDVLPFGDAGDLLIADSLNHRLRIYKAASDTVTTVVGTGQRGWHDAVEGTAADLNYPTGLASDGTVVFIADRGNNCIRRWGGTANVGVTTIAGDCSLGEWGHVDGKGPAARFSGPTNLALLPSSSQNDVAANTLYVSDMANNAIRVLVMTEAEGDAMVSTLVPSLGGDNGLRMPSGISLGTVAGSLTLFVANYEGGTVKQYTGLVGDKAEELLTVAGSGTIGYADGGSQNASFHGVKSVSWSPKLQKLFASDFFNHRIRTLTPTNALRGTSSFSQERESSEGTLFAATMAVEAVPADAPPATKDDTSNDIRVMVWTGHSGPYHDHFSNGKILADALNRTDGISTTLPCVVGEAAAGHGCEEAFASPALRNDVDVLLIYADTYENPERGTLTDEQWEGLFSFVQQGGGLFALHTASACWMHSCNQSECQQTHTDCSSNASTAHTPQCENSRKFHVDVMNCEFAGHSAYKDYVSTVTDPINDPITNGLSDYIVTDELYHPHVFDRERSTIFLTAFDYTANQTAVHGLRHTYGKGRVLYFAQGHDMAEFDNAQFDTGNHAFGTIIKRSIRWLAGKD